MTLSKVKKEKVLPYDYESDPDAEEGVEGAGDQTASQQ